MESIEDTSKNDQNRSNQSEGRQNRFDRQSSTNKGSVITLKQKRIEAQQKLEREKREKQNVQQIQADYKVRGLDFCYYCGEKFNVGERIPRILIHCGHTFCTECLSILHHNFRVRCPICRKLVKQVESVDKLPLNFNILYEIVERDSILRDINFEEEECIDCLLCDKHDQRVQHFYCSNHLTVFCRECIKEDHTDERCFVVDLYEIEKMRKMHRLNQQSNKKQLEKRKDGADQSCVTQEITPDQVEGDPKWFLKRRALLMQKQQQQQQQQLMMLQQQSQLLKGANPAQMQTQDPNVILAMLNNAQLQAQQAALLNENPSAIPQFMPPPNYELDQKALAQHAQRHQRIFDDDEEEKGEDDGSPDDDEDEDEDDDDEEEDDDDLESNPQDNEDDDSKMDDEYDDDSDEQEDEDYPYANSDPEELANRLKNGHSIEDSQSSPDKPENGESKIEKFAQEAKLAEKLEKLDISESNGKVTNGIQDKENIEIAKQAE